MIRQLRSTSTAPNKRFLSLKRAAGETNTTWLARALEGTKKNKVQDCSWVLLLGGADTLSFRLRVAQSHLRRDMLPSYWSEVGLIELGDSAVASAKVAHVPLAQSAVDLFPPRTNGVRHDPLQSFDDPERYPNIALVCFPVAESKVAEALARFEQSRSTLDTLSHVLRWLAFGWGVGQDGNPLLQGFGIPSACMLDAVFSAAGLDISPGLESRTSCPEAIWTAALYWHDFYQRRGGAAPVGAFSRDHRYPILEPSKPSHAPTPSPGGAAAAKRKRPAKRSKRRPTRKSRKPAQ